MRVALGTIRHGRSRHGLLALVAALVAIFALALPAGASAAEWTLTVNLTGEGHGEVECKVREPGEEEYEEYCEGLGKHPNNTQITVVPIAEEESSRFGGFENGTGSAAGCAKACSFKLTANSSVNARFDLKEFNLIAKTAGTGKGAVECSTAGPFGPCAPKYPYGTEVTLLAEAEEGSDFAAWSGACEYAEEEEECELTIEGEATVTATFNLQPKLKIEKKGTGAGTVECEVEGFLVEPCEPHYPKGTELVLVAEPGEGSAFVKWEGGCDLIAGEECELAMNADRTVKATFNIAAKPKFKLTVSKSGTGSGTVTSTPAGINCGTGPACEAEFEEGVEVTLSQSPASGSEFVKWTGACSGSGACKVTMGAAKPVGVKFDAQPSGGGGSGGGTGGGSGGRSTTPPPPPPPAAGTASAAATATVTSGKAALKVTCSGGPCSGTLQLAAKVKQGKKAKSLVIGNASFGLASGASTTLNVKLSGPAKQEMAKGKTIKAQVGGTGVAGSTVTLKAAKTQKRHTG